MGAEDHVKAVQLIYEAFGRADVQAILDHLTDDVDWAVEPDGPAPWNGLRRGKPEVAAFFQSLGETVEVTDFTPLAFATNDSDVMVVIRYGARGRSTGKSATMDLHHWWRFRDGKVFYVRGTEDTAKTKELLVAG
jgi:uncharacterized protein